MSILLYFSYVSNYHYQFYYFSSLNNVYLIYPFTAYPTIMDFHEMTSLWRIMCLIYSFVFCICIYHCISNNKNYLTIIVFSSYFDGCPWPTLELPFWHRGEDATKVALAFIFASEFLVYSFSIRICFLFNSFQQKQICKLSFFRNSLSVELAREIS